MKLILMLPIRRILRLQLVLRTMSCIGSDAFAVTSSDTERHIGDVIGGYESVTDAYVISSITNIIVKLNDDTVDISYSVGDATRKG